MECVSMNDEYFMMIAYEEAKKAINKEEIPVGAIIVKNDKVIAKAHNKKNKTNRIIDHAEILAIKKANRKLHNWRLDDCVMYITLEPCPMCASAIEQSRIKKIVTGANNYNDNYNKITKEILKSINWNKNILHKECSKLINDFFSKKRK